MSNLIISMIWLTLAILFMIGYFAQVYYGPKWGYRKKFALLIIALICVVVGLIFTF